MIFKELKGLLAIRNCLRSKTGAFKIDRMDATNWNLKFFKSKTTLELLEILDSK